MRAVLAVRGIVLIAILLGALAPSAAASQPTLGGRYVERVNLGRDSSIQVNLVVSNDGKEFAADSYVMPIILCANAIYYGAGFLRLDGAGHYRPFVAVPIRSGGRFRYVQDASYAGPRNARDWIAGHFTKLGRAAVGTFVAHIARDCPVIRIHFHARLVGTPDAPRKGGPSTCDRVRVGRDELGEAYDVQEQGVGCTTARQIARLVHRSAACSTLAEGGGCRVGSVNCLAIHGGRFSSLASIRCSPAGRPKQIAELTHLTPCAAPQGVTLRAINVDCATVVSVPVARLVEPGTPEEEACATLNGGVISEQRPYRCPPLAGFSCTITWLGSPGNTMLYDGRCLDDADPFRAFEFNIDWLELSNPPGG